jgi:hypothetical protein
MSDLARLDAAAGEGFWSFEMAREAPPRSSVSIFLTRAPRIGKGSFSDQVAGAARVACMGEASIFRAS